MNWFDIFDSVDSGLLEESLLWLLMADIEALIGERNSKKEDQSGGLLLK